MEAWGWFGSHRGIGGVGIGPPCVYLRADQVPQGTFEGSGGDLGARRADFGAVWGRMEQIWGFWKAVGVPGGVLGCHPPPFLTLLGSCRRRMQGWAVLWVPGTDHAGIATQVSIVSPNVPKWW